MRDYSSLHAIFPSVCHSELSTALSWLGLCQPEDHELIKVLTALHYEGVTMDYLNYATGIGIMKYCILYCALAGIINVEYVACVLLHSCTGYYQPREAAWLSAGPP